MIDPNTGEETAEVPALAEPPAQSQDQAVDQQQDLTQETTEAETGQTQDGEIPKDNAAWAAMRHENKRLKEALDSADPAYLESLRGATSPQQYVQKQTPQVTGDAEYAQVTEGVNWASRQAAQANQEIANLRNQMELQQDREAERAYPELKADKVFQQIVAEKKLAARVLGHQRTTLEIADEVSRLLGRRDAQITAKTEEVTRQRIVERQALSSEPRGQTTSGRSYQSNEDLRQRVRRGDTAAETELARGLIADLDIT